MIIESISFCISGISEHKIKCELIEKFNNSSIIEAIKDATLTIQGEYIEATFKESLTIKDEDR